MNGFLKNLFKGILSSGISKGVDLHDKERIKTIENKTNINKHLIKTIKKIEKPKLKPKHVKVIKPTRISKSKFNRKEEN